MEYRNTKENNEKIIKEVVDLWNTTQKHLPKVVCVSSYLKTLIVNAYRELGIENIKKVFEKVNVTPRLNGTRNTNNSDYHATIDFVMKTHNCAKILNGDYDEIVQEEPTQEEQERLSLLAKRVIHREKQKLGRSIDDFLEKELFTDEEQAILKSANRLLDDGYYISDEELQIGIYENSLESA